MSFSPVHYTTQTSLVWPGPAASFSGWPPSGGMLANPHPEPRRGGDTDTAGGCAFYSARYHMWKRWEPESDCAGRLWPGRWRCTQQQARCQGSEPQACTRDRAYTTWVRCARRRAAACARRRQQAAEAAQGVPRLCGGAVTSAYVRCRHPLQFHANPLSCPPRVLMALV